MKILIDIGHPAHVHYFRNFIHLMQEKGHSFMVTARNREPIPALLRHYNIPFVSRGKGGRSKPAKILYFPVAVIKQIIHAWKFKPDVFLDFSTIYSGPAAFIFRKPWLTFTDTEHTRAYRFFIRPFCRAVYTPTCFQKDLGKNHFRFEGLMEMAALHSRYFEASPHVLQKLGLSEDDKFAIVRFVGETAWHDLGKKKLGASQKVRLVRKLQSLGRVFISTESPLPEELRPLKLDIEPHEMHHLLSYATLVVGNGATLAAEAAVLGTPAVYISDLRPGYLDYLEKQYGLVMNFGVGEKDFHMAVKTARTLMGRPGGKGNALRQAEKLQADHLDVTRFLMETVEGVHE